VYEVVYDRTRVDSDAEMITAIEQDPDGPIPVVAPADLLADVRPGADRGHVQVVAYRPGHVLLRSRSPRPALLIARHKWAPGWSVAVDGAPAALLPAVGIYMAVRVPGGEHDVALHYEEPGLRLGLALAAGWVALTALVVLGRRVELNWRG
jgi:hypothetical protein